jgi:hypothetical protein
MPGGCPDAADGMCPEWSCTQCAAALLDLVLPQPSWTAAPVYVPGRVA